MNYGIVVFTQSEFQLNCLFQTFETPVSFLLFYGGYSQEFIDGFFWTIDFELFRIVVLVFDVDISLGRFVVVLVVKVIPVCLSVSLSAPSQRTYCS